MKKKKIVLFVFLMMGVLSLILTYKFKQNNLRNNKPIKEEKLSIMIKEDGATEYTKSSSKDIPKGNYTLNTEKSYCKNNGKIEGYDSATGTVSFAFIGTDRCFLYFDYKIPPLYNIIENRYNANDEYVKLYNGSDYGDTTTYANNIYYFTGAVKNNNVQFANYCWMIVRTTDTGGVKIVYNGVQKDFYTSESLNQSEYSNLTNDASYPYTYDEINKTWTSTNTGENNSTISFTAPSNGDYVINYDLSMYSGENYVNVEIFKDDVSQGKFTGNVEGQIVFKGLTTSNVIKIVFTRKYSWTSGNRNNVVFSFGKVNSIIKTCNNTGTDTIIGTSAFNSKYNSPAYVGYMYNENKVYTYSYKTIINSADFSGQKAYGDGATYASYEYTLTNAATLTVSSSNISSLVGKYTCNSSSITETCYDLWYIAGYSGTTIYYYSLYGGTTDGTTLANQDYVFGSSFTHVNGTYTLTDTVTINSDTWYANSTNVNTHHYTCLKNGNSCTSVYYVYEITNGGISYITLTEGKSVEDALNEMLYADDVNTKDSTIKTYIDKWYEEKIKGKYDNKLEDTIFCNDRTISDKAGWNPNGRSTSTTLYFQNMDTSNKSLACENNNDRFTVSTSNGNGKLTYPIGLLTVPELSLAGYGSSHYLNNGPSVWLGSPNYFNGRAGVREVSSGRWYNNGVEGLSGVRPSISLKPGTEISSGDGSYTKPFVIN